MVVRGPGSAGKRGMVGCEGPLWLAERLLLVGSFVGRRECVWVVLVLVGCVSWCCCGPGRKGSAGVIMGSWDGDIALRQSLG